MIRKPLPKKLELVPPGPPAPPPPPFAEWNLVGVSALSQPLPPVPWICQGLLLAPGAVSLVVGYGFSRKTMAMQALGLSVAAGKPIWGVWRCTQGRFLHLDYEQGLRINADRYQRLARGMGFELSDLPEDALRVACMPRVYLETDAAVEELVKIIGDAKLVLVDSLRAAFPHADENSSEVRSYLDVLTRVSERTGACIVVIHHSRKPSMQNGTNETHAIRGSAAIFDACQSVFFFTGESADEPTRIKHKKDRIHGTPLPEFGIMARDVAGPSGPRHALVVSHLDGEQLSGGDDARENAKEAMLVEQTAERIVLAIAGCGFAFHGSSASANSLVRVKTQVFKAAWTKLVSAGILVRGGSYREPVWRLSAGEDDDPVPEFPSGSHPVPEPPRNPVPGSLSRREGTVLHHAADSDPVPRLLGDENLFRKPDDSKEWWER